MLLLGAVIVALGGFFLVVQDKATQLAFLSAFALLPGAFVLGLVRSRFFRTAAVGRLIEGLAADHGAAGVRDALRAALGDPTLDGRVLAAATRSATSTATAARSRCRPQGTGAR